MESMQSEQLYNSNSDFSLTFLVVIDILIQLLCMKMEYM